MIRDILAEHFERYPLMVPQDAVKLIYQRVFGPGHLIRDPEAALRAIGETDVRAIRDDLTGKERMKLLLLQRCRRLYDILLRVVKI